VVVGATPEQVLVAFGADPGEPPVPAFDVWEEGLPTVAIRQVPGAVVAVEDSFEGSRACVLERVSANTRVASLYQNINAVTSLSLAEDGRVLFHQDEVLQAPDVEDAALAPFFADLDWDLENWKACALTVLERFTGIRIDGPPPADPHLVHRLIPHLDPAPQFVAAPDAPDDPWLHSSDSSLGATAFGGDAVRELTAAVRRAPVEARRRLAAFAVRQALRAVGLEDHPDLATTLATLDSPSGPILAPEAELLIRRTLNVGHGFEPTAAYNPAKALHNACSPDSVAAALDACWRAGYTLWWAERSAGPPAGAYLNDDEMTGRSTGQATPGFLRQAFDILAGQAPGPS
jgi:hypothetical protein